MKINIGGIALLWGFIATALAIVVDIFLKFTTIAQNAMGRNVLYLLTIFLIAICIYMAVRMYRKQKQSEAKFLFFQGFSVASLTTFCYALLFSVYLFIMAHTIFPDMFDRYKQQQIIAIEKTEKTEEEKFKQIQSIQNMSEFGILVNNFIQSLIFPLTISLFVAVFMQQKQSINTQKE